MGPHLSTQDASKVMSSRARKQTPPEGKGYMDSDTVPRITKRWYSIDAGMG